MLHGTTETRLLFHAAWRGSSFKMTRIYLNDDQFGQANMGFSWLTVIFESCLSRSKERKGIRRVCLTATHNGFLCQA